MADGETRHSSEDGHRSDRRRAEGRGVKDAPCSPVEKPEPTLAGEPLAWPADVKVRERSAVGKAPGEVEPTSSSSPDKTDESSRVKVEKICANVLEHTQHPPSHRAEASLSTMKEEPSLAGNNSQAAIARSRNNSGPLHASGQPRVNRAWKMSRREAGRNHARKRCARNAQT
jgi:hypothetical protein